MGKGEFWLLSNWNLFGAWDLVIGISLFVSICDLYFEKEITSIPIDILLA
jgi:hypothetical protein